MENQQDYCVLFECGFLGDTLSFVFLNLMSCLVAQVLYIDMSSRG